MNKSVNSDNDDASSVESLVPFLSEDEDDVDMIPPVIVIKHGAKSIKRKRAGNDEDENRNKIKRRKLQ